MSDIAPLPVQSVQSPMQGRQSKFTPANIRQIMNLLERGKTNEEIAEVIGVTPATLKFTCSKLGISLRRRPASAAGLARFRKRQLYQNGQSPDVSDQSYVNAAAIEDAKHQKQPAREAAATDEEQAVVTLNPNRGLTRKADLCGAAITMRYKGEERLIDIPLDRNLLGLFALEAEFRSTSVGNLIGQMLHRIAKNDMFALFLEQARTTVNLVAPPSEHRAAQRDAPCEGSSSR